MWVKCTGLWLSVLFFFLSTGNCQQSTRGGRLALIDEQSETRKSLGIDKVKALGFSADTRLPSTKWNADVKNKESKGEDNPMTKTDIPSFAPMSLTRSQLNGFLLSTQEKRQNQPRPTNNGGRDLQEVTHLQRKKCDGIKKIVQCKDDIPEETCRQELVDNGIDVVSDMKGTIFFAICIQTLQEIDLVSKLTVAESIEDDPPRSLSYMYESGVVRTLQVGEQVVPYGVELVKAPEFWDVYGSRGAGIKVCVIDTGVRPSHEDLAGVNISGSDNDDFVTPWNDDGNSHGTHVTGTIAAQDNGVGVIGVAPDVSIYVVRILDDDGISDASSIVEAAFACYDAGADIINMSLGGVGHSPAERKALRTLGNLGVLMVAASGNYGDQSNFIQYPAGYEDVMSVGAVDDKMRIAEFSNYNPYVDVVAPGVDVLSLYSASDTSYISYNGTSMATPHVTGIAALLWSQFPYLGVDSIRTAITESAKDIGACGYDVVYGSGMIDVMAAAAFVENMTAVAPEQESCIEVEVTVTTDEWGNETTFLITEEGSPDNIYYRGGPYKFGRPDTYTHDFLLQDGCYYLILRDYFGDGILNETGDPVITLTYAGIEQVSDNNFTWWEKVYIFGNCNRRSLSLSSNVINQCGDGIVDDEEECDDGNSYYNDACLNDCTSARCGDGYIHNDIEECDDGNNINGDGCSSSCRIEKPPPTCSPEDTLLHIRFAGDIQAHYDNSLYLYDDASPDDDYIWYVERLQFDASSEYVGYACLKPSACYRFFFFDVMGDGLETGGLTLTNDGNLVMRIRPGDIGTVVGDQANTGTYWSESFGSCIQSAKNDQISWLTNYY